MKNIQFFKPYHINQPACKRQLIGWKIKKRVIGYGNFVIKKVFGEQIKPRSARQPATLKAISVYRWASLFIRVKSSFLCYQAHLS